MSVYNQRLDDICKGYRLFHKIFGAVISRRPFPWAAGKTVYIDNKENDASGIDVINNCGFSNTANDQQIKKIHSRTATILISQADVFTFFTC
jgi:hypothetical protein